MPRIRIRFSRGEELKFISHLDIIRLWVRALRRAQISLEYSSGFSPHPKISLAVPLPLGVTGTNELMDVYVTRTMSPQWFIDTINRQLPAGIKILEASPIGASVPSLQSQIRFIQYQVKLKTDKNEEQLKDEIDRILSLETLPWHHQRDTGQRNYDLRVLIDDVWLDSCEQETCTLGMRLRCDNKGTGRPEQVAKALDFTDQPISIKRTRLLLNTNNN